MIQPTYLNVTEKDKHGNLHMDPDNKPNLPKAIPQWKRLAEGAYIMLGVVGHFMNPVPGLPDMTFTANGAFTFIGKDGRKYMIRSKFRPERRKGEERYFESYFMHTLHYAVINIWTDEYGTKNKNPIYFEGAGDAIPFGDAILMGYGFRTSYGMARELRAISGKRVIPLKLQKGDEGDKILYHLDTTMIVIDDPLEKIIIAYKHAFSKYSWNCLVREVKRQKGTLIEASYGDAAGLALNAVVIPTKEIILNETHAQKDPLLYSHFQNIKAAIKDKEKNFKGVIITSDTASQELLNIINNLGYYPLTLPLGEFLKSGGGAFCLTKILCD
ncbi:MAG: hypothetical protein HYT93_04365 [Parcubacteria group bacterium]|nr:hypothetical protein [Parcubacteria group bacterium]